MTQNSAKVLPFPSSTPYDVRRGVLAAGDQGVALTVWLMWQAAFGNKLPNRDGQPEGASNPYVRQQALEIVRGLDPRDKQSQIAAVLEWVKQHIEFRGENGELVQTPLVTLQLAAGDCDDHSTLIAALLKTLGFNARFRTVAADANQPQQFTHVFAEVFDPVQRQWIALDSTVPGSYPGWTPNNVYRSVDWKMPTLGDASLMPTDGSGGDVMNTITQLVQPIDQALAYKIAYGDRSATGNLSFGNPFGLNAVPQGGIPWNYALLALAIIGMFAWHPWRR